MVTVTLVATVPLLAKVAEVVMQVAPEQAATVGTTGFAVP